MEETRILVVDDEQEIADLLELYLISDGYQVIKSEDALEGLAIMEREKIDLVLLDIMMPKTDRAVLGLFLFIRRIQIPVTPKL